MFDAQGRIVLLNRRYIDMYKLSPQIVQPGCTLRELIQHRKDTGLFSGDVDAYCQKILDGVAQGQSTQFYVQASDGRIVLAKNEPLPGGGWVSTHEDVTEQRQRRAGTRRHPRPGAAARDHRHGDRLVPAADGEAAVQRERQRHRHALDRERAARLLRSDLAARRKRGAGLQRSLRQRGDRGGRGRRIVALDRRDQPPAHATPAMSSAWRPSEARATDGEIAGLADGAQKIGDVVKLIRNIAGQTNLLALNATIEAARAGEAGTRLRGGGLRSQVAGGADRQGDRGDRQPNSRRCRTRPRGAVEAIRQIAARMQEINAYTSAVAAAVEQQNAATGEISHNVASAAQGTGHVVAVLGEVAGAATRDARLGGSRARCLAAVEAAVANLRREVEDFLAKVAV